MPVDSYSSEVLAALVAAISALSGVALAHFFSKRQHLGQQQWEVRERHYMELLRHLTKARLRLRQQGEYFNELDSEYRDYSADNRFARLGQDAHASLAALEQLAGPARVFLSSKAINALEQLVRGTWNASMDSMHAGEYVAAATELVEKAEAEVLAAAKWHLN